MQSAYEILEKVLLIESPAQVALELGKSEATIRRWQNRTTKTPDLAKDRLLAILEKSIEVKKKNAKFSFIDLFAGIGGLRLAFEGIGGRCVFTSEWDDYAQRTYLHNYPSSLKDLVGDITKVDENEYTRSRYSTGRLPMSALFNSRGIQEERFGACPWIYG
ncbi:hypothetical protein MASR2M48_34020 [Spirochaetota bacterium]